MVRHGASLKIKCFKVLLYTRSKAKTRYNFGKGQGLAREREKKRVTPEFGERKEEKILPPNSGRYSFGGRFYSRHVRSIHNSTQNDDKGSQQQKPQCSSQASGQHQSSFRPPAPRGRGARGFGGRFGDQPRRIFCLFCGENKGHTTRMCHVTI
jgi:hypothetical protein